MDVQRLTFDLAVYEVGMTDNWCAPDYAKEHFEKGVFIVHDGINYQFCSWNGGSEYVYTVVLPNDFILGVMAKEIKKSVENSLSELLLSMSNAIKSNGKVLDLLRNEISAHDILSIEIVDENKSEEEKALDKISYLGAQIVDILLHMKGHHHVTITETDVILYDEGMSLFHSDPF